MALTLLLATTPGAEAQSAPAASSDSTVPEVVVTGQKEVAREGTTEDGYRTTSASLGPLGKAPLKDIPYSIRAVSSDLIENLQAGSTADALKYDPTVRSQLGSNFSSNYFMIRGFSSSPFGSTANAALEGTDLAGASVESVLTNLESLPADKQTAVRNNAGGHANHSLFWQIMSPDGGGAICGPAETEANLYADGYKPPAGSTPKAVRVNPGTILVQARPSESVRCMSIFGP